MGIGKQTAVFAIITNSMATPQLFSAIGAMVFFGFLPPPASQVILNSQSQSWWYHSPCLGLVVIRHLN